MVGGVNTVWVFAAVTGRCAFSIRWTTKVLPALESCVLDSLGPFGVGKGGGKKKNQGNRSFKENFLRLPSSSAVLLQHVLGFMAGKNVLSLHSERGWLTDT